MKQRGGAPCFNNLALLILLKMPESGSLNRAQTRGILVKIQTTAIGLLRAPLRIPFKTALRTVTTLEEITVQVSDSEGFVGWGSVVPTPAITGDSEEKIRDDLEEILRLLRRTPLHHPRQWKQELDLTHSYSRSALSAVDVAIHDLVAHRSGRPLWSELGGTESRVLATNMTISVDDPDVMALRASEAVRDGFTALKVKVGPNSELDQKRVLAIRRAVGERVSLRLDANQGWSEEEALKVIPWFAQHCGPIDFIEQPVKAEQLQAMQRITLSSPIPIVADESAMTLSQVKEVLDKRAAHGISVKLIKAGGIAEACAILDMASEHNIPCLMSCMFECGAGLQAAVHIASIHPAVKWIDLDAAEFLSGMPYSGGAKFSGPVIQCGSSSGLGINLSSSLSAAE